MPVQSAESPTPTLERDAKKFLPRDARIFTGKLILASTIAAVSAYWIVTTNWMLALPAQVALGVIFAHAVELQHQTLHGTGFRSPRKSRAAGVLLGIPMLVCYSRYKALHLLHHRFLGTDKDTEFFSYATGGEITLPALLSSAFNVRRWGAAIVDMARAFLPGARYDHAIADGRVHRRIRAEYRMMAALLAIGIVASWWSGSALLISLWLIPLVFAEPVHFLIELPEHLFCDRTTRDIFLNTRTIRGGWFSFWLTNGNNYHVEHHLRMGVPINKLPILHDSVSHREVHYCRTYGKFYGQVLRRVWRASKSSRIIVSE